MGDELDHILVSEEHITPSSGFLAAVMEAVHCSSNHDIPIRFPWSRFFWGLAGGLVCAGASVAALVIWAWPHPGAPGAQTRLPTAAGLHLTPVLFMLVALVATLLTVRFAVEATAD